ncbi:MAG: thymidine phosphorylase [Ruminococcus sp.]|nr:thymidine phosphorylase [Ruminococcus sp.]
MNIIDIINKTKRQTELSADEIAWVVDGYTAGEIPDAQMAAWLMAVRLRGLTERETSALTLAMLRSGSYVDLSGISAVTVDKHSTGGVGDKTTLIVGPAVAACGAAVPKMSGRGLGHTGGTIDKLESIPGFRTELEHEEFISVVEKNGFAVTSQSRELCPADKRIYALRDITGTVDSIPLICSSIMSKKLAVGADCLLLDVKYGSGAFMKTSDEARRLAGLMESTGRAAGKRVRADVTDMNAPLGSCIGNALEVREAIEVLQGRISSGQLYDTCVQLGADMLELAEQGDNDSVNRIRKAIADGSALEVLRRTIEMQGGDPGVCDDTSLLPQARCSYTLRASSDIRVNSVDCEELGMVSLILGAGRLSSGDRLDPTAGIVMECAPGDRLAAGAPILTLYSSLCSDFSEAAVRALNAIDRSACRIAAY